MFWIDEIRKDIASISCSAKELKKFGLLVGAVLMMISLAAMWKQWWSPILIYAFGICGFGLFAIGIINPAALKHVYRYWMGFAIVLGSIVSRIILFILFFIVLTPMAITARVLRKRFFFFYKEDDRRSFWIDREKAKHVNYERMN